MSEHRPADSNQVESNQVDSMVLGAAISQVVATCEPGTTVIFVAEESPTTADRDLAERVAGHAGLAERAGWALVSSGDEPALDTALDDLAATGTRQTILLVSLSGSQLADLPDRTDGLEVLALEIG